MAKSFYFLIVLSVVGLLQSARADVSGAEVINPDTPAGRNVSRAQEVLRKCGYDSVANQVDEYVSRGWLRKGSLQGQEADTSALNYITLNSVTLPLFKDLNLNLPDHYRLLLSISAALVHELTHVGQNRILTRLRGNWSQKILGLSNAAEYEAWGAEIVARDDFIRCAERQKLGDSFIDAAYDGKLEALREFIDDHHCFSVAASDCRPWKDLRADILKARDLRKKDRKAADAVLAQGERSEMTGLNRLVPGLPADPLDGIGRPVADNPGEPDVPASFCSKDEYWDYMDGDFVPRMTRASRNSAAAGDYIRTLESRVDALQIRISDVERRDPSGANAAFLAEARRQIQVVQKEQAAFAVLMASARQLADRYESAFQGLIKENRVHDCGKPGARVKPRHTTPKPAPLVLKQPHLPGKFCSADVKEQLEALAREFLETARQQEAAWRVWAARFDTSENKNIVARAAQYRTMIEGLLKEITDRKIENCSLTPSAPLNTGAFAPVAPPAKTGADSGSVRLSDDGKWTVTTLAKRTYPARWDADHTVSGVVNSYIVALTPSIYRSRSGQVYRIGTYHAELVRIISGAPREAPLLNLLEANLCVEHAQSVSATFDNGVTVTRINSPEHDLCGSEFLTPKGAKYLKHLELVLKAADADRTTVSWDLQF